MIPFRRSNTLRLSSNATRSPRNNFERSAAWVVQPRNRVVYEAVDDILTRLEKRRTLAVMGASGAGKSSVIRGGVVPAILEGAVGYGGARWTIARSTLATRILAERFTTV
jgi:ABC-type glutathione transport system ATPase component